ncbi:cytochrome c oxidase subunit II [Burkholderia sp. AU19243]|uniref:cytochrome c oxidase subunit II n=1 Tax=Burkholderia TaxID=32008 RepID=UPI0009F1DED6|nr:cytochrome c oxidase subunit II [Burkholderia vietnamiensis]MBR8363631.1 cytochrome c oxidase subunit II [Burkholderia sp. AU19243]MBY4693326.1 cytochrome c oxidase subunit II [Burkholderia latens]
MVLRAASPPRRAIVRELAAARRLCAAATLAATSCAHAAWPDQNALRPAGIQAVRIASLWHWTLLVCALVFAAVLAALALALWRRAPAGAAAPMEDDRPLPPDPRRERRASRVTRTATAASVVVLAGLIVADVLTDRALSRLPVTDALRIEMTGHQWWWDVRYPADGAGGDGGFATANELHVPVGRAVIVSLKAADVIHTFWAPNLHGKKDMIPGRDATIAFRVDKPGRYRGQCAEYCGLEHALMAFVVVAEPQAQFDAWVAQQRRPAVDAPSSFAQAGQRVFVAGACATCHTVRGTPASGTLGPDLTHVMSRSMLAGGTFPNDRAHLARWLRTPGALKPGTTMPPSTLSPMEQQAVIAWLETLR